MAPNEPAMFSEIAQRTRWFIRLSWFLLPAIGLPSFLAELLKTHRAYNPIATLILLVIAMGANAIFFALTHVKKDSLTYYRTIAAALVAFYIVLITIIIYTRGGLESRSVILYIFPILVSAPIFGRRAVYVSAAISILLYDAQVVADFANILPPLGVAIPPLHDNLSYAVETVVYISSVLILCAVIADYITRLLIDKERQALENLAGLNKAQQIAKMGSWEWDCATDEVNYSEGIYRLLQLNPRERFTMIDFVHPDDRAIARQAVEEALKQKKPFRFDTRLLVPGLPLKYMHSEGEPVLDKTGKVIKLFGTVQDMTDVRQLDIAKSDFVAIASHQLRTPASSVKQYIGMLLGGYAGDVPDMQRKMLQTAYESNERQIIIVNDLLYVAQLESGNLRMKPTVVDLVALLQDIVEEVAPRYQAVDQTITFASKVRHFKCKLDATLMRMVIENLIDNAHKYSGPNQKIAVRFSYADDSINIAIRDKGVGIAPEDIKKLFQKFSRVENALSSSAGGSGLGLYLSHKLVAMHGGTIEVSSRTGKGSTFTIVLPGSRAVQKPHAKTPTSKTRT